MTRLLRLDVRPGFDSRPGGSRPGGSAPLDPPDSSCVAAANLRWPAPGARPLDEATSLELTPYERCELGCLTCDARRAELVVPRGTEAEPSEALGRELARLSARSPGAPITLGARADPYPPRERAAGVTRALLEALAGLDGVRLLLETRSELVLRDLDVLRELARRGQVRVAIGIATLDRDLARLIEPRAPAPGARLAVVSRLVAAGLSAGVHAAPVVPGVTDGPRDLRALVCESQAAGARWLRATPLVLEPGARAGVFAWLERHRPELVTSYRRWYRAPRPAAGVAERIDRTVALLGRQYGLRDLAAVTPRPGPRQLSLFGTGAA